MFAILLIILVNSCSDSNTKIIQKDISRDTAIISTKKDSIENNDRPEVNLDSVKKEILIYRDKQRLSKLDTLKYKFTFDDVGTEGNEGNAYYLNGELIKFDIVIYTGMNQIFLSYKFDASTIKVSERTYAYKSMNADIRSKKDLIEKSIYDIDTLGKPLDNKTERHRNDVFDIIKNNVPFKL